MTTYNLGDEVWRMVKNKPQKYYICVIQQSYQDNTHGGLYIDFELLVNYKICDDLDTPVPPYDSPWYTAKQLFPSKQSLMKHVFGEEE